MLKNTIQINSDFLLSILYLYAALLPLFASCEKDLEPYSMEECRLNFRYYHSFYDRWMTTEDLESSDDSYRTTVYSFVYAGGVERDTLWFPVQTSGFLSDVSRPIALQQMTVPDTVDNAEEGLAKACEATGAQILDYSAVPVFMDPHTK